MEVRLRDGSRSIQSPIQQCDRIGLASRIADKRELNLTENETVPFLIQAMLHSIMVLGLDCQCLG